jgi:hypothetical protein
MSGEPIMTKHQNMAQGRSPYEEFSETIGKSATRNREYEGGHIHPGHGAHYDDHSHTTDPEKEGSQHHGEHGHHHTPVHHPEHHHGGHKHMHHHHPSEHDGGHGGHPTHGRKRNF